MGKLIKNTRKKICSKCKIEKSTSSFYYKRDAKDGLTNVCTDCNSILNREYREKNYDYVNAKNKRWRDNNPDKVAAYQEKHNKAHAANLTYGYLIHKLIRKGFDKESITPQLIAMQKQLTILRRNIKNYEKL